MQEQGSTSGNLVHKERDDDNSDVSFDEPEEIIVDELSTLHVEEFAVVSNPNPNWEVNEWKQEQITSAMVDDAIDQLNNHPAPDRAKLLKLKKMMELILRSIRARQTKTTSLSTQASLSLLLDYSQRLYQRLLALFPGNTMEALIKEGNQLRSTCERYLQLMIDGIDSDDPMPHQEFHSCIGKLLSAISSHDERRRHLISSISNGTTFDDFADGDLSFESVLLCVFTQTIDMKASLGESLFALLHEYSNTSIRANLLMELQTWNGPFITTGVDLAEENILRLWDGLFPISLSFPRIFKKIELFRLGLRSTFHTKDLKAAEVDAAIVRDAGYSFKEMREAGYSALDLKKAVVSLDNMVAAGYTIIELKDAGFTAAELRGVDMSLQDQKSAGYNIIELKDAGFTAAESKDAGFSLRDIEGAGYTIKYDISTVAGCSSCGFSGDGGPATAASLYHPRAIAVDSAGNMFISDYSNHRVRKVSADGKITTVAGGSIVNFKGDGGPATAASLNHPTGIAVDKTGNIFISDSGHCCIRKVSVDGIITTVAGKGSGGFSGDGGPATAACFNSLFGIAVDNAGNLFICDYYNYRVRKVSVGGIITTVAGDGKDAFKGDGGPATAASVNRPRDIAVDNAGNLFICDENNNRVRKVSADGKISTVAGGGKCGFSEDGGLATEAALSPYGVAVDNAGNLFISDCTRGVRKVSADGIITTVAGNGSRGLFGGDGGPATAASFNLPYGIAVGNDGNVYICDYDNHRIRMLC
jgi:sugar lactone lactonase YvrE